MDLTTIIHDVTLSKVCGIKPDADSTESKQITLNVKYDGLTLGDVFQKALRTDVIAWQNGPGRKHFELWDGKVDITAKSPGRSQLDPETAMVLHLKTLSPGEQEKYLNDMMKKARK